MTDPDPEPARVPRRRRRPRPRGAQRRRWAPAGAASDVERDLTARALDRSVRVARRRNASCSRSHGRRPAGRYASGAPAKVAFAPPGSSQATVLPTTLYKAGSPRAGACTSPRRRSPTPGVWKAVVLISGKTGAVRGAGQRHGRRARRRRRCTPRAVTDAHEHARRQADLHPPTPVPAAHGLARRT